MAWYHAPPIRSLALRYLLIPPAVLALVTVLGLLAHSTVDVALLWSQCHSRARIPHLSRVPALGTPACFLVSFLGEALDAQRSRAVLAVALGFVGALATVCWLESRRGCNRAASSVVARPALPWLAMTLGGGALVWHGLVVPAFVCRARSIYLLHYEASAAAADAAGEQETSEEEEIGDCDRTLPDSDVVAVAVAVAVGFYVPLAIMLAVRSPVAIALWLLFPLWVEGVRMAVRRAVEVARRTGPADVVLERHWQAVLLVYAVPVAVSVASQVLLVWNLMGGHDDRRKMTRLTAGLVEIEVQSVAWGVLYWLFVEAGWRLPLFVMAVSVCLGPGAGICLGWLYRERLVRHGFGPEEDMESSTENTPLLR